MNPADGGWLAVNPKGSHSREEARGGGWKKARRRDGPQKSRVKTPHKPLGKEACAEEIAPEGPQLEILPKARKARFVPIHRTCGVPTPGHNWGMYDDVIPLNLLHTVGVILGKSSVGTRR